MRGSDLAAHKTIAEAWELEAQRLPSAYTDAEVCLARAWFYIGALAATVCESDRDQVLRELVAHGSTIGRAAS